MKIVTLDIEIYRNYSLFMFKNHATNRVTYVEAHDGQPIDVRRLNKLMSSHVTITFNGNGYDLPIISAALKGVTSSQLKDISDDIIVNNLKPWEVRSKYNLPYPNFNTIDIKEPSFGVAISLKLYGARLGTQKLQDLPISPDDLIKTSDTALMRQYCENDLNLTWELYSAQKGQFDLRRNMGKDLGQDLMSKSDPQIAESVFKAELEALGVSVGKVKVPKSYEFNYTPPHWVKFASPVLQEVLKTVETTKFALSDKMAVVLPKALSKAIPFNGAKYKFGIGGLHSQEKKQSVVAEHGEFLIDIDVASFYPAIILQQNLFPRHLTKNFTEVYRKIVNTRLAAKRSGNKVVADSLKITINGSFGKFGSQYSFLFSPNLLIQTTITGQLGLLMLIEMIEDAGFDVKSANTDGIIVNGKLSDYDKFVSTYFEWELLTGFDLEETNYCAVYSRDINNYIAVKTDGSTKGKGIYTPPSLAKNPETPIVYEAVVNYITTGEGFVEYLERNMSQVTKFLSVKTVNGGAVWRERYLGRVARWYYSVDGESIHYKKNNNKVGKSDGAKPMMDLLEVLPADLDFNHYVQLCVDAYTDLGLAYEGV